MVEQASSQNTYFVVHALTGSFFNQPNPDGPVSTMFGPTASFWKTTLDQAIFESWFY